MDQGKVLTFLWVWGMWSLTLPYSCQTIHVHSGLPVEQTGRMGMTTQHVFALFKNLLLLVTGIKRRYPSRVNEGMKAGTHVSMSSQGKKAMETGRTTCWDWQPHHTQGEAVSFTILPSPFSSSPATVPKGSKHRWQIIVIKPEAITFNEVVFFLLIFVPFYWGKYPGSSNWTSAGWFVLESPRARWPSDHHFSKLRVQTARVKIGPQELRAPCWPGAAVLCEWS